MAPYSTHSLDRLNSSLLLSQLQLTKQLNYAVMLNNMTALSRLATLNSVSGLGGLSGLSSLGAFSQQSAGLAALGLPQIITANSGMGTNVLGLPEIIQAPGAGGRNGMADFYRQPSGRSFWLNMFSQMGTSWAASSVKRNMITTAEVRSALDAYDMAHFERIADTAARANAIIEWMNKEENKEIRLALYAAGNAKIGDDLALAALRRRALEVKAAIIAGRPELAKKDIFRPKGFHIPNVVTAEQKEAREARVKTLEGISGAVMQQHGNRGRGLTGREAISSEETPS